jgi:hypothetical protein
MHRAAVGFWPDTSAIGIDEAVTAIRDNQDTARLHDAIGPQSDE